MSGEQPGREEIEETSEEAGTVKQQSSLAGSLLHKLIFLNWVQSPPLPLVPDLSEPAAFFSADDPDFPQSNISHFFISSPRTGAGVPGKLGAWYMLPPTSTGKVESLSSSDVVLLYLHGNGYNRSQTHRVSLYKVFLSLGYYVLSIDYRGYGDSTNIAPTEQSVVSDARAGLAWLTSKLGEKVKVVVWGHSLGTAIASHMIAEFDLETGGTSPVSGLVLEAPFNCMRDEVMTFKAARALQSFVNIEETLEQSDMAFKTNKWLPAVKCPVLIFHAEDDNVVPYELAVKLHQQTREAGKENVRFVTFPASLGLAHNYLYQSETVKTELTQFVAEISK